MIVETKIVIQKIPEENKEVARIEATNALREIIKITTGTTLWLTKSLIILKRNKGK